MPLYGASRPKADPNSVFGAIPLNDDSTISRAGAQCTYVPASSFPGCTVLVVAVEGGTGVRIRAGDHHTSALASFVPTDGQAAGWPVFPGQKEFYSMPLGAGVTIDLFGTGVSCTLMGI